MHLLLTTIAAQLDLMTSVIGTVVVIALSFAVITLIASYYRFQSIVEKAERLQPEEMGATSEEVLRVQLARYIAGCGRRGTSFSISLIRISNETVSVRMDGPIVLALKEAARRDDITYIYDDQTVALFTETEPEDSETILTRITGVVAQACDGLALEAMRVGIASYPGHGLSGRELIDTALEALEATHDEQRILLPEIIDVDAEDEEEDKGVDGENSTYEFVEDEEIDHEDLEDDLDDGEDEDDEDEDEEKVGRRGKRKNAMLDELTGVLKPSAISPYMQRQMSELRRKKQTAALFCVGVNNMEHIERFHGEDAANDVMVGVSKVMQEHFRSVDLIGRHEKHAFLVLAQCSLEEAELIGRRVSMLIQNARFESGTKKLKTQITLGVAAYPDHGRNLHHLYTAGQKVLDHSRINDIRAYAVYDPEIHDTVPSKPMKSIKSIQA